MKAVLSNPNHPEYGVATIPLPIPKGEYDNCIAILKALEIGDTVNADCRVEEIHCDSPILRRLESGSVNVDELDYLAKRLDSFDQRELAQFLALTVSQNIHKVGDFINLTFSCQDIPIVQDFTDLEKTGRQCYMDRHGSTLSPHEQNIDFKREAMILLQNESGKVTPYGVIYDEGFRLEQLYDGRHFPQYHYEDCVVEVEIIPEQLSHEQKPSTFLCLPVSELQLERAMVRGGCLEGNVELDFLDSRLPKETDVLDLEEADIGEINPLCHAVSKLDENEMKKLGAVISFAGPDSAEGVQHLAEQLDLFDFVPGVTTAEEYGRHMIMESGHFEYDENLSDFYDFEKYGRQRVENEYGQFTSHGYVSYHGVVSMEELLAGVPCERMEMGGMC